MDRLNLSKSQRLSASFLEGRSLGTFDSITLGKNLITCEFFCILEGDCLVFESMY